MCKIVQLGKWYEAIRQGSIPGEHRKFHFLYDVQTSSEAYSVVYPEFEVINADVTFTSDAPF
jgi:hypothetical protein